MKYNHIERLLPGIFQRVIRSDGPLRALTEVMESLHEPSETILEQLDAIFDARRTPPVFVPFLARWLDLHRLFDHQTGSNEDKNSASYYPTTIQLERLRELIATAAYLSQWRGTAKGLILFLECATGVQGFRVDEQATFENRPIPFHLDIWAPQSAESYRILIDRIIESEKPAYVTYRLMFETPKVPQS